MDHREEFIRSITADLAGMMDIGMAQNVIGMVTVRLAGYSLNREETQLSVVESESDEFLRMFLATKKIEGRSDRTLKRYRYEIQRMMKACGVPVRDITVFSLRKYLAQLRINGVSVNSVAGLRSIFCSYFGWLHREGMLDHDPSAQLSAVKPEHSIEKPFSDTEIERLRESCCKERDRALIEFLRSTGCRIDEVVRLNVSDVDLDRMEAKVHGKGGKERIVYLDEIAALRLKWYLAHRKNSSDALFDGSGTERLTASAVRMMMKGLAKRSGVTNVHPHRFRRTMATSMIRHGMPVQDVGRLLGHANINTTMKYVYMDDASVANAYRKYAR